MDGKEAVVIYVSSSEFVAFLCIFGILVKPEFKDFTESRVFFSIVGSFKKREKGIN